MGISWSRDPQGFQHTLVKCMASELLVREWGSCSCGHNIAWRVDICQQYDVWMDNCLGFWGRAGNRIWSVIVFHHLITKSISSPLLVIFGVWLYCWQFQLLLCNQCVLELVVVDGQVLKQGWVIKPFPLVRSGKVHPVLLLLRKQQQA